MVVGLTASVSANPAIQSPASAPAQVPSAAPPALPAGVEPPAGYTIGTDDVLSIVFWRDKDMSADVVVRPDGRISLPLVNEVQAAGLTPDQLRVRLEAAASALVRDPKATVVVKQINSLKVFITGEVVKPGGYSINSPLTVLQLIAMSGGLQEFADREHIVIVRTEQGKQVSYRFNYKDVAQGKRIEQNIPLKAGDTVLVP